MTEFPALRDALVGAAARRRRRRRAIGAAIPALAAAAAVAVTLISLPSGGREREREEAAPKPRTTLEQAYGVFRRPQRPQDRMPAGPSGQYAIDPARSRLVGRDGSTRFFAAPSPDGRSLCTVVVSGGGYGGGCGRVSDALRRDRPPGAWQGTTYALLFQDGTRDVRLLREDGSSVASPIRDNGVLARSPVEFAGVSWSSPSGIRYVNRVAAAPPHAGGPPETCPAALDPLPEDALAEARRAALLAVDRLYPFVGEAEVTAAKRPQGTPCGSAISARSIEVSLRLVPTDPSQRKSARLSEGRLLVGMRQGAMRVFYLLH